MNTEKCVLCGQIKSVSVYLGLKSGGTAPLCKECHEKWSDSDLEWNGELKELEDLKCQNGNIKSK